MATSGNKSDAGLAKVENLAPSELPVSVQQQAALDKKSDAASLAKVATSGNKVDVGLGNVSNLAPADMSVSNLQQAALNLKANSANPSTTGLLSHSGGRIDVSSGPDYWGGFKSNSISQSLHVYYRGGTNTIVGEIGTDGGAAVSGGNGSNFAILAAGLLILQAGGGYVIPAADAAISMGSAQYRFSQIAAASGTIVTSDEREKTGFRTLTEVEISAARDLARAIGVYQWKAAISLKGHEDAREHIGPTVQRAIEIMQQHGLDPFNYGFICHDQWDAQIIEHEAVIAGAGRVARDAWTETVPAGDRYAFRYDELNQFVAAGLEARLSVMEAKFAALDAAAA